MATSSMRQESPGTAAGAGFTRVLAETLGIDDLAYCILDHERIIHANPRCLALFSTPIEPGVTALPALASEGDRARVGERLREFFVRGRNSSRLSFQAEGARGESVDIELQAVPALIGGGREALAVLFDVTARRRQEERIDFLAFLDPLTGLPNRAMFLDRCREMRLGPRDPESPFAVLRADLDGIKAVRDHHGSVTGDMLVKVLAERLAGSVRDRDVVARLGGGEFAILLSSLGDPRDVRMVAERIVRSVVGPVSLGNTTLKAGISLGIAVYPGHATTMDTLFELAGRAMAASKAAGRNRYQVAEPVPEADPDASAGPHHDIHGLINRLVAELQNGRPRNELMVTFEAIVQCAERRLRGGEPPVDPHLAPPLPEPHGQWLAELRAFGENLDQRGIALTLRFLEAWRLRQAGALGPP